MIALTPRACLLLLGVLAAGTAVAAAAPSAGGDMTALAQRKTCRAPDGVTIAYSAAGHGEPAIIFVHGGLADRSFWDKQLATFSGSHRVVALDLPGHGESGSNRTVWGIPEFGADIVAVADAESLQQVVIVGNSLGGPVAIEAALLLGRRAVGVVGVDTFQSLDYKITPEEARQRAEAFRNDYAGSVEAMVQMLFHPDADPEIVRDAERRMMKSPPEAAAAMFLGMAGYEPGASARRLAVPLRAINGDLYPTDTAGVRRLTPDFKAVVMKHMGHYPMLERPDEFNRHLTAVVEEIWSRSEPSR
jgi:sigma-B regulation protein RsbQ